MLRKLVLPLAVLGLALSYTALRADNQALKVDLRLDRPVLHAHGNQDVVLRLRLEGLRRQARHRPPLNLVLVVDRSGSMSGEKMENAKLGAREAVRRLGSQDTLALVGFDDQVRVFLPAQRLQRPEAAYEAIDALQPGGSTALYAGMAEGIKQARRFAGEGRVSRIILLSDGLANVGPQSPAAIAQLGRQAGQAGIAISTLGLGLGYDEDLMTRLAQASDGNHAFVENATDLARILDHELGDALAVAVRDIVIEIHLASGVHLKRSLGRDLKVDGQILSLHLNQVAEGQQKLLMLDLQAPEGSAGSSADLAQVSVVGEDASTSKRETFTQPLSVSYSSDEDAVTKSTDEGVVADAATARANEARSEAIMLRDAGQTRQASALLKNEAAKLKAMAGGLGAANAPAAAQANAFSDDLEKESGEMAAPSADWNATRKEMKQKAYSKSNQQTY